MMVLNKHYSWRFVSGHLLFERLLAHRLHMLPNLWSLLEMRYGAVVCKRSSTFPPSKWDNTITFAYNLIRQLSRNDFTSNCSNSDK